jgi:hypothetical protein
MGSNRRHSKHQARRRPKEIQTKKNQERELGRYRKDAIIEGVNIPINQVNRLFARK